jgi:hypothetical protein
MHEVLLARIRSRLMANRIFRLAALLWYKYLRLSLSYRRDNIPTQANYGISTSYIESRWGHRSDRKMAIKTIRAEGTVIPKGSFVQFKHTYNKNGDFTK